MAVAGNADPMLGYLTTSFREHPRIRRRTGRQISSAMKTRLSALGAIDESGEAVGRGAESLYGVYQKAGGDRRTFEALREEGARKISALAERGFDLDSESVEVSTPLAEAASRIDVIYRNARNALYATTDDSVIRDVCPRHTRVRTKSTDRDDYLAHPPTGEEICDQDAVRISALYAVVRPKIQIVISDGLNANALNENLRLVLPFLRQQLVLAGHDIGEVDVVIENGRLRAGYHVGLLLDVEVIVHLIGERPGTGIDTMSAYLTYGRDTAGGSRWGPQFDHSWTTAVCGIHHRGKRPELAVEEITRLVNRVAKQRCSGVALR
jgi:ethanolamine ammonia-lyase large subunit